ncbi:MAG TPA: phosphonate ABC transporter, permease protein PhnE [Myxococcales bacterium]|nr:phosphonate ABC transporter, permease protein PhnE [Myxococcales bacterium]
MRRRALFIGLLALAVWSFAGIGADLPALFGSEGRHQMAEYVRQLWPPDLARDTLRDALGGALETFAISFVGTLLAVAIAVPLAVLTTLGAPVRAPARLFANALRTIPELVWALIFVFVVGLGPFPGVLALGLHTGGVLGKLFGEVLHDVDRGPLEALQSAGAPRPAVLLYGVLPQAAPQCVSLALYRWEVNIRAAAIMGFVGAGGLGQRIYIAISLFLEHRLLTLVLAIYLMVTLVDALSARLRQRLV